MTDDLFDQKAAICRSAKMSDCGAYRYRLGRVWDAGAGTVCWVMLNPSTTDALKDDPTVRRCIAFTKRWGYGALAVVNLYPLITPDPKALASWAWHAFNPPHHPNMLSDNLDRHVIPVARKSALVIAAWGRSGPDPQYPLDAAEEIACEADCDLRCLGTNKDGSPKHPLARGRNRVADDQAPVVWRAA